jgi:predicted porin
LAALAATSAFAQSSVTLSGRASLDYSTYGATGSAGGAATDFKSRARVADTSSRITFAANEDLGGGAKAGVYCETGINIDNGSSYGQANTQNVNTSTWCSREGRIYYGNTLGEIRLGRQNVWWTQGQLNQVGSNLLGSDSFTNLQNGGAGVYTVRGENMIKLVAGADAGDFANSEIYAGYMGYSGGNPTAFSGSADTNGVGEGAKAGQDASGRYAGFKVNYAAGNVLGMIDYQTSKASPATTTVSSFDRTGVKLGLGYKYAGTSSPSMVSFQTWNKKRTDVTNSAATYAVTTSAATTGIAGTAKDSGYGLVVEHDLGANRMLIAQWGKANALKDASGNELANTGANGYTLGGLQRLSKRTHVYAAYHVIKNQSGGIYNMTGGNYASATSNPGADVKVLALGLQHWF